MSKEKLTTEEFLENDEFAQTLFDYARSQGKKVVGKMVNGKPKINKKKKKEENH